MRFVGKGVEFATSCSVFPMLADAQGMTMTIMMSMMFMLRAGDWCWALDKYLLCREHLGDWDGSNTSHDELGRVFCGFLSGTRQPQTSKTATMKQIDQTKCSQLFERAHEGKAKTLDGPTVFGPTLYSPMVFLYSPVKYVNFGIE